MKKLKKLGLAIFLVVAIICQSITPIIALDNKSSDQQNIVVKDYEAKLSGSFVQSWLANSWSAEQWDKEMSAYKQAGMDHLILADIANQTRNGSWDIYYPSDLPELRRNNFYGDVVKKALTAAKKVGIKVFLGMGGFDLWWDTHSSTAAYTKYCATSAKIVTELYSKYGEEFKDTFYGWYYVPEIFNVPTIMEGKAADNLISGFNTIIEAINKTGRKDMPVMLSSFLSDDPSYLKLDKSEEFYKRFLTEVNFRDGDILCPQDAVGAGWTKLENVEANYIMYKKTVDFANSKGKNIKFWSNCEDFAQFRQGGNNDAFHSTDMNQFIAQMNIAKKYCQRIITFSYSHYYSPYNISDIFHKAYIKYAKDGFVDTQPPTKVEKVRTDYIASDKQLTLSWTKSEDQSGISRYAIIINGRLSDYVTVKRLDGGGGLSQLVTKYIVPDLNAPSEGKIINIEIIPYDVFGNAGEAFKLELTKDNLNNGVDVGGSSGEYKQALKGYDFLPLYNFDFWTENDNTMGTPMDLNDYLIEFPIDSYIYEVKGSKQGALSGVGMKFVGKQSGGFQGITIDLLNKNNPDKGKNFGKSEYLSFYIDTTKRYTSLRIWTIFYDLDRDNYQYTAFAPKSGSPCYLEENGELLEMMCGDQSVTVPNGYKGRVYIPVNEDTFIPIWNTKNANNKIDLGQISKFKLSFDDVGAYGTEFTVDEIGFFRKPGITPDPFEILEFSKGDVNNDKKITTVDALMIIKNIANMQEFTKVQKLAADVNNDDKITGIDALLILKFIAHVK